MVATENPWEFPMMSHSAKAVQPRSATSDQESGAIEMSRQGKVYLVGAGPGDPGLLTVRGQQCLKRAEIVLYDGLANPQILTWASQAECICVGKHGKTPIWTQSEINAKLVELGQQGKLVVRLKGGDPAVFARTAEELEVLAKAGVPFEVVPGITAALAAGSYVGIPITHRQHASAVAFVTGQQQNTKPPQPVDWDALAKFPGTLVFYMGVTTVAQWTEQLLKHGKSFDTPVAIVRRCTWSDQTVIRCHLGDVANRLTPASKLRPPVIVIIGEVAALGKDFDWFTRRPLHGLGILVTRPTDQSAELADSLQALGADVYQQPMLEICPPGDTSDLDSAVDMLRAGDVQGLTFSSPNGVHNFMRHLTRSSCDSRVLAGCRVAVVGPATADACAGYGLIADVRPDEGGDFSADGLVKVLSGSVRNEHWIVTQTTNSRRLLPDGLRAQGARVTETLAYETVAASELDSHVIAALENNRIQMCTITSSAIARTANQLLHSYRSRVAPISLSTNVSRTLDELRWPSAAQAQENSTQALVEAILEAQSQHSG